MQKAKKQTKISWVMAADECCLQNFGIFILMGCLFSSTLLLYTFYIFPPPAELQSSSTAQWHGRVSGMYPVCLLFLGVG